ncbi:MAG: alginate O-acetyltransferase complex protein AlgI [Halieaceae bacterium]|jgi:alginate O-acetyltransferase complex protein AlgI
MLFSSYQFLIYFLPCCLLLVAVARQFGRVPSLLALLSLSLVFYSFFHPPYLLLITISIAVNYWGAELAVAYRKRSLLIALIVFDLGLLGAFKYLGLLVGTLGRVGDIELPAINILLPLAISFFAFQQVAYVVDRWRGDIGPSSFLNYAVFISFFPQLIAGPIVRYQYVSGALATNGARVSLDRFAWGVSLFVVGLAKKVLLADSFGDIAAPSFDLNEQGGSLARADAWTALLAYSLQIYFDFSAYSDMAIGLAALFGFQLPVNFLSPYKSRSISEFWRRWHISLSEFLRDYLYIPLGGNRSGQARRLTNLMLVMLLGGLWHGADWAFLLWGGIHGGMLVFEQGFRALRTDLKYFKLLHEGLSKLAIPATFLLVTIAWVPFRANGLAWIDFYHALAFGAGNGSLGWQPAGLVALGLLVIWTLPNTMEIFAHHDHRHEVPAYQGFLRWRPSVFWLISAVLLLILSMFIMLGGEPNEFIYFQF